MSYENIFLHKSYDIFKKFASDKFRWTFVERDGG